MSGFLIHLAAPMMSFGVSSQFSFRDSHDVPTRSALIGMVAAALGRPRVHSLNDLRELTFTIRVDREGTPQVDYHTAGGGYERNRTIPTAQGTRKPSGTSTVQSWRHYVSDAAFTVAVEGPENLIDQAQDALVRPHWPLFLGRAAFPVTGPFTVTRIVTNPVDELAKFPVHRPRPRSGHTVTLTYVHHRQMPGGSHTRLHDEPKSFDPWAREYEEREEYRTYVEHPVQACTGYGIRWVEALEFYLH